MPAYRYSRWDGRQQVFPPDDSAIMGELSDQLLQHGDINAALRALMRSGLPQPFGERGMGLQDLLDRLQKRRRDTMKQYNLDSALDDIRAKLDSIFEKEERGLQRELDRSQALRAEDAGETSGLDPEVRRKLAEDLERRASRSGESLAAVPRDDPAQAIEALRGYEFMDAEAKAEFDELLNTLRRQAAESFFRDITKSLEQMSPEQMRAMREMMSDLNEMLEEKINGGDPDFDGFMQRWGDMFGDDPPKDFDDLLDRLRRQMAQTQSLLDSLSADQSQQLQDLMQSAFGDSPEMAAEMRRLAANMDYMDPLASMSRQYSFTGDEEIDLSGALDLMGQLQNMDDLERQIRRTRQGAPDEIDRTLLEETLGPEARQALDQLTELADRLEREGYIRKVGGSFELSPKGMRKLGQRALQEIFAYIKKERVGGHQVERHGPGVEHTDETKPYEFGDAFTPHLQRTIMNAVMRDSSGTPVHIRPEDFEVYRTEQLSQAATVLMVDLSLSMAMRGNFMAAKKVALALDNLIRSKFTRDKLFIVGFSTYAREIKADRLPYLSWDEFDPYTNIQHGLAVSQKLLSKIKGGTKQIIMISDGEPTAHMEGGQLYLQYPPSPRTIRATLAEARRCTQQDIVINTFMLDRNFYLIDFIDQLTRINRGRVFYTTPDRLGQYILVDYLSSRKRKMVV